MAGTLAHCVPLPEDSTAATAAATAGGAAAGASTGSGGGSKGKGKKGRGEEGKEEGGAAPPPSMQLLDVAQVRPPPALPPLNCSPSVCLPLQTYPSLSMFHFCPQPSLEPMNPTTPYLLNPFTPLPLYPFTLLSPLAAAPLLPLCTLSSPLNCVPTLLSLLLLPLSLPPLCARPGATGV